MHMVATVHILLNVESDGEAADALSGLLTECGIYEDNSGVVDWSYRHAAGGGYQFAVPVEIPADYDRDEADLAAIAKRADAISEAATRDDLDEACAIVQEAHGIKSGDGAGYYFSGENGDAWRDADSAARAGMLRDWLSIETVES